MFENENAPPQNQQQPPAAPPAAPAPTITQQQQLPAAPPQAPPARTQQHDDEHDPPTVIGHGGRPMNEQSISEKMERERRKILRDEYGTADPEKIAQIKQQRAENDRVAAENRDKLASYEQQDAERKRASMTEVEQLRADLAAKDAELTKLRQELDRAKRDTMTERQTREVERAAASARIKPKAVRLLNQDLAAHYQSLTAVEKKAWNGTTAARQLERYVARWAKENPEYVDAPAPAKVEEQTEAAPTTTPATPPGPRPVPTIRRPLGTARPAAAPPPKAPIVQKGPGMNEHGKTVAPGPNQMNAKELADYMKKRNMKPLSTFAPKRSS